MEKKPGVIPVTGAFITSQIQNATKVLLKTKEPLHMMKRIVKHASTEKPQETEKPKAPKAPKETEKPLETDAPMEETETPAAIDNDIDMDVDEAKDMDIHIENDAQETDEAGPDDDTVLARP